MNICLNVSTHSTGGMLFLKKAVKAALRLFDSFELSSDKNWIYSRVRGQVPDSFMS